MKFLTAIVLLSIVRSSLLVTLECSYQLAALKSYVCFNSNLVINENNVNITEVVGIHVAGKSIYSVKTIYFLSSSMRRLPQNVFTFLPKLKRFIVHGMDVQGKHLDREALIPGDFKGAKNLSLININGVNLHYIRANVFEGADNLDFLSLEACGIFNIDENAFNGLSKLRSLSLNYNLIKFLHNDTFSSLTSLNVLMVAGNFIETILESHFVNLKAITKISFISNQIQVIDSELTRSLTNLKKFYLGRNVCIDATFGRDRTPIEHFSQIVWNCTLANSYENRVAKLSMQNSELREKASTLTKQIAEIQSEKQSLQNDIRSIVLQKSKKEELDDCLQTNNFKV